MTMKTHRVIHFLQRQTFGAFRCLVQEVATEDRQSGATRMTGNMTGQTESMPVLTERH